MPTSQNPPNAHAIRKPDLFAPFPPHMDITNPRILKLKGILFLLLGALSAAILLIRSLDLQTAALLAVTIWSFCRFYYFAFYVLHEYADPNFKYAGLWDLCLYMLGSKKQRPRREACESISDSAT